MSIWTGHTAPAQLTRNPRDWVGLGARLVLGVALTFAGALKVGNLAGNAYQVGLYRLPLSTGLQTVIGYAQPFVEILVGLLLIAGLFTRCSAVLGALAMVLFIAGIAWAWTMGLRIDCGCFSPGGELGADEATKYLQDIIRDAGFFLCGLWLWARPASVLAIDNWLLAPLPPHGHSPDGGAS